MKHLKLYEDLFSGGFGGTYSNRWFRRWKEVWYIPIKFNKITLSKIVDIDKVEYWSRQVENEENELDRFHLLLSKDGIWRSFLLNNIEIEKFRKKGIYNEVEITPEEKEKYYMEENAEKYNL